MSARQMTDQSAERNEPCCVNFDIELETTNRDKRNVLLSIQFSETEIEGKSISKHRLRLVLKRCDLGLELENCVLPINKRANINPLNILLKSRVKESTETRNKKNKKYSVDGNAALDKKMGLSAGYNVESSTEQVNQVSKQSDVSTYHIALDGGETNPTWKFLSSVGKPLVGQYLNESLGEIAIENRPYQIVARASAWKKDMTIIDAEGLFAKSLLKQKLAAAFIQSILGLGIAGIAHEKPVNIT